MKSSTVAGHLMSALLFSVLACQPLQAEIIKPEFDPRDYQHVTLGNGLEVVLISDPEAENAGAALTVSLGSDQDPDSLPGLAHLLEHAVFSGSEDYPDEGGFGRYISQQGGHFNAYTAPDHTNYYFQLSPGTLNEALNRFADFLIAPSLTEEAVENEIGNIQSEFEGSRRQQDWEELSVFRGALNPAHPFSRFAMGNAETLSAEPVEGLTKRLRRWHREHYAADRMKLVVLGRESAEDLEKQVRDAFKPLPEESAGKRRSVNEPLLKQNAGKQPPLELRVSGEGRTNRLFLSFPVEPPHKNDQVQPYAYIANLLTSEREGRLPEALRESDLANELSAGWRVNAQDYATFDISIPLTKAGKDDPDAVIAMVFRYLDGIRETGLKKALYKEQQRTVDEAFRNPEKASAANFTAQLAASFQRYPAEEVLSGPVLLGGFERKIIARALEALTPENLILTHSGLSEELNEELSEEDPYSAAHYEIRAISDQRQSDWKDSSGEHRFRLEAEPNPYIAEEKTVHPQEQQGNKPELLSERDGYRFWYRQDGRFDSPRGGVYLAVESPAANDGDQGPILNTLLALVYGDILRELNQSGQEAGLGLHTIRDSHGLTFMLYGFTANQEQFLRDAMAQVHKVRITERLLKRAVDQAWLQTNQYLNLQPGQKLTMNAQLAMNPAVNSPEEEIKAMQKVEPEELEAYRRALWNHPEIEVLAHGNYQPRHARAISDRIRASLPTEPAVLEQRNRRVTLDEPRTLTRKSVKGEAVAIYRRLARDPEHAAPLVLASQMLHNHIFDAFRTDDQGGYLALNSLGEDYRHRGTVTVVQQPGEEPESIAEKVNQETQAFLKELDELSDEDFEKHKSGARTLLRTSKERLSTRAAYWWQTLGHYGKPIDEAGQAEQDLATLSKEDFHRFCHSLLGPDHAQTLTLLSSAR